MYVKNPILPGFYPDPSVCRAGDKFYLVNSTFTYFPGIPVFESENMADWKQIGNVLERPDQVSFKDCSHSQGIYAPAIRFYDGVFYVAAANVGGGGNFVVTAKSPAGPWSELHFLGESAKGIDPSLFFDEDGTCWYIGQRENSDGSRYFGDCEIWLQRFNTENFCLEGEAHVVLKGFQKNAVWPEGPHLYKKGEYYYILHAEGGTEENHCVVAARSKCVTGPYEYCPKNPILTHRHLGKKAEITCVGHGDFVEDRRGDWYMVVLGCRPERGYTLKGRETFLARVQWEDDWPVINPGKGILEKEVEIWEKAEGEALNTGFIKGDLPLEFLTIGTPEEGMILRDEKKGSFILKMQETTLKEGNSPSYIAVRLQHSCCEVSAEFKLFEEEGKDCAGLAVLQDDKNHIRFEYYGKEKYIRIVSCCRGKEETIKEIREASEAFKIVINGLKADFWKRHKDCWSVAASNVDLRFLSTEEAGGFTGCTAGMYASANGRKSQGYAEFEKFAYVTVRYNMN